jgi:hypothetical protein
MPGSKRTTEERIRVLEETLAALWGNTCDRCARPLHPRSTECLGCTADAARAWADAMEVRRGR